MIDISNRHPYWFIRSIAEMYYSDIFEFYFSYYEYTPQSVVDSRYSFNVGVDEFLNENYIEHLINRCPAGRELAFHSAVKTTGDGTLKHIPMIDMHTNSIAQLSKLKNYVGEEIYSTVRWYKSGRSFHGYFGGLYDERSWLSLMGIFLLVNQLGLPPAVDPRWVGHRLIAGYSALRWTSNTDQYLEVPKLIDKKTHNFFSFL